MDGGHIFNFFIKQLFHPVSCLDLTFIVQNTYISQPKFIKIIKRCKTGIRLNASLNQFSGKDITVSSIRRNLKKRDRDIMPK